MILITGGMGFIGLHTARRFLDAGEQVLLTYHRTWREPAFLHGEFGNRVKVASVDLTSPFALLELIRQHSITGIVHLAVPGLGALSASEEYRVNMTGLINVLEAARLSEVKRVTLASSVAVYRGLSGGPYYEDAPLPVESGSATESYKKAWDVLGLHYAQTTGLDVRLLRIGVIYGPLYHSMSNLPSRFCHAAVKGSSPGVVPNADDETDFCYVKDCAVGIQLVQMATGLSHRIYNLGGGRAATNAEVAQAVRRAVPGAQIETRPGRSPQGKAHGYMDLTRIQEATGYRPKYSLDEGIADYADWLRLHPQ